MRNYELKDSNGEVPYEILKHGRVFEFIPSAKVIGSAPGKDDGKPKRGKIKGLSAGSWGRMIRTLSRIPILEGFGTLTLPGAWKTKISDGKDLKRHFNNWHRSVSRIYPDQFSGMVWILEFQKRGAPHFHFWTIGKPPENGSETISRDWFGRVGADRNEWVETIHADSAARYAAKESGKRFQKIPPVGFRSGRMYGTRGELNLLSVENCGRAIAADLPPEILGKNGKPFRVVFGDSFDPSFSAR